MSIPLSTRLNAHYARNVWPGVVALKLEILILEVEDALHIGVQLHLRQRARSARELQPYLLQMIEVDVCIACSVDEFSWLQAAHLRHHLQQQGIGCDVEGHAEEGVGAALIELQREFAVGNLKLEQAVAGRQVHLLYVCHIPCADNHTARVRVVSYLVYHIRYLVDMAAVGCRP